MRNLGFTRVLIDIELRSFQSVVCATLARARFGVSSFWIWHSIKTSLVKKRFAFPVLRELQIASTIGDPLGPPNVGRSDLSHNHNLSNYDLPRIRDKGLCNPAGKATAPVNSTGSAR